MGSSGVCYAGWLLTSRSDRWWREGGGREWGKSAFGRKNVISVSAQTHTCKEGRRGKGGVWDRLTTAKERQTLSCRSPLLFPVFRDLFPLLPNKTCVGQLGPKMYCTRTVLTLCLWSETGRRCVVTTLVFPGGIGNGSLFSSLLFCGYVGGWRGVVLLGSKTRVRGGDDRTPKRLGFMYTPLPLLRNSEGRLTLLRRGTNGRTEKEE